MPAIALIFASVAAALLAVVVKLCFAISISLALWLWLGLGAVIGFVLVPAVIVGIRLLDAFERRGAPPFPGRGLKA